MPAPLKRPVQLRRSRLLQGASVVAFVAALGTGPASAQLAALRNATHAGGNGAGVPTIAAPVVPGVTPAARNSATRQLQNAMAAQQTVNLAQQAQTAARQAAAAIASNVPNGLASGGLVPVANPTLAANDPTGLNTWQGANLPTQSVASNGSVTVDVQQTAQRAILDWQTFNVGANTTLNFDQSQNGVAQPDWVVLNRVVGQIDPTTGLRNPNLAPAPSQILGSIKAQGTVLVINQNGILFGPTAQVNTNSLIATSLEIGNQLKAAASGTGDVATTLADRDSIFLSDGLLGQAGQNETQGVTPSTFSGMMTTTISGSGSNAKITNIPDPMQEGSITVDAGTQITSGTGGYIILAAPQVTNSGVLSSFQGQVSLVGGQTLVLYPSDGSTGQADDPNVRGLVPVVGDTTISGGLVENTSTGLIQSPQGYASLTTSGGQGTAINEGAITSTTSVSRNGFIQITAPNVELAPGSVLAITPDDSGTIPQDPNSLADFKPSQISIGLTQSNPFTAGSNGVPAFNAVQSGADIDLASGSLIYAPSANIYIGGSPGTAGSAGRVFVDSGAVIDASGLKNVQMPSSVDEVTISPVTTNDTADSPADRSALDGATVTVDPRLSGVRSDGVAWVGSPLIPAGGFAQQVGVTASQLMTKGGNVVLGAGTATGTGQPADVIVKPGATIDISGGWVTFPAGMVDTTLVVDTSGLVIPIGEADPTTDTFIGVYNGFTVTQPRYGISQTFANPLLTGAHYEAAYNQGADAGSLTIQSSSPILEGTVYAQAFPGPVQNQQAQIGTGTPTVFGDQRPVQAVGSQLPVNGFLFLEEAQGTQLSGGNVEITAGSTPDIADNLTYGQTPTVGTGGLPVVPSRPTASLPPTADEENSVLSASALSAMGLGQLSIETSGSLTVDDGANLTLTPGGIFGAVTGRAITINGSITAPAGTINLVTVEASTNGSVFMPAAAQAGDFDVTINGQLSTAGLWVNDFATAPGSLQGDAYINGGSVNISAEARVSTDGGPASTAQTLAGTAPASSTDISGSILVDGPHSLIDVSSGGYIAPDGTLNLSAKGGDVSLSAATTYFPLAFGVQVDQGLNFEAGAIPGFRVNGLFVGTDSSATQVSVNPSTINAKVAIGDGAIRGYGFAGGGTFSLTTPAIAFGDTIATTGTELPLDFFSKAGFGTYDITSYATDLIPNAFNNGLGGYNAVLATQILTVGAGQTLDLTQTGYSNHLSGAQIAGLRNLGTGGRISRIVQPGIQPDGFDQLPVSLNFGGLVEFEVASGGQVTGAAGASLSASQINNLGTIRLPGGTLSQSETLPELYVAAVDASQGAAGEGFASGVVSAPSLSDIFSTNADGTIDENAPSRANPSLTNAQLAAQDAIFLTGDLPANVGINLASGSVTDLSGESLRNPFATGVTQGRQVITGTIVAGGTVQTAAPSFGGGNRLVVGSSFDQNPTDNAAQSASPDPLLEQPGLTLVAAPGSTIGLAGASDTFDQLTSTGKFTPTLQWSNGGSITIGAGGTLAGANIDAHGGAPGAAGGTLTLSTGVAGQDVMLAATDPTAPAHNIFSATQIESSGFDTLVVEGGLATSGAAPVNLSLNGAFFLTGLSASTDFIFTQTTNASIAPTAQQLQPFAPTVSVAGSLLISAPYIALQGVSQTLASPTDSTGSVVAPTGAVTFSGQTVDVTGAVLFDPSVANVTLQSSGDIRFTGVEPFNQATTGVAPSLMGQLAVNGNLTLAAAQVYATTGSSFDVTSAATSGTITIASTGAAPPPTPYSAGSSLTIQAADIVQDGVVRAPIGSLTLGSNTPLTLTDSGNTSTFAPATTNLTLGAGSVTSVSADGLSIPYGTTTDQKEYFFSPTDANPITAPPAAVLTLGGQNVTTSSGAVVDLKGGGDLFAYEFVPGTGGSRDVLSQFNSDAFSGNNGYQFPDHRQVYAIVPGLSNAPVAAYDPVYSSNYNPLYGPSMAGQRVYLNGGNGVAPGWYTLLPAQYAVLPGGMEVVEDTTAKTVPVGASLVLPDGTVTVTGEFGGLGGTAQSTPHVFDIKSQAVINAASDIALTSVDTSFAAQAAANGTTAPRLPIDSGRLVINPSASLDLSGTFETTPGQGGRGSEVDISSASIQIVSALGPATPGAVQLSADQLNSLNADSLLIGGVRTDNADGTTSLDVTAHQITIGNDAANPLSGPDILLAVDGSGASLTVKDGATITASGTDTTGQTGNYVIDGSTAGMTGQGALVRVSAGPQRLLTRQNASGSAQPGVLTVGAAKLSGASVMLDSSGAFTLSSSAAFAATNLTLDASSIAFAPSAQGLSGLVITPSLLTSLSQAQTLTLRTPSVISFTDGDYGFGDLALDTPGVAVSGGTGTVSLTANTVQVQDSFTDAGACAGGGTLACGAGQFALQAQSLTFSDGTFRIYGAGQGVSLSAPQGVMFQGQGAFDVGAAPLSIQTAFLGDQLAPDGQIGDPSTLPSLAITTTGDITLSNPTGAAVPTVSGVPGATLTLAGNDISVTGVDVRATAGTLTLTAAQNVTVGAGTTLETPGFAESFGDASDPFSVSAPGGLLTLTATTGNITLAQGSTLSVGGGTGNAGALTLNASQGTVSFGGTLNGSAPGGGAGFALNEGGSFDLTGFMSNGGSAFNGEVSIETGAGNLTLAAGQTLTAQDVVLVADGGRVDIAGTIDVSGVNGGDVGLFGTSGVTLESGASVLARASGYGATDTRQASGGNVELGTVGSGDITVAAGAVIDVSAQNTTARAVPQVENGVTNFTYVPGDVGGTVTLRGPVSGGDGAETVNVSFAGQINGASSIVLEGFKPYDLAAIAASGQFSGVTVANGVATLDTTATGKPNFLADNAPGTLVDFIQNFNVSGSYANLGGLASQANFHARPGVELDYSGDIDLASNWNLGAGTVNVAGAVAAGLMVADPALPGSFSVIPGDEAAVFSNFTTLTYRVGGSVLGEPGMLTVRAGGQFNVDGSITDGFFTFGDQTDPNFLNTVLGGKVSNAVISTGCTGSCATVGSFSPGDTSTNAVSINFPNANTISSIAANSGAALIPYDAAANTPGALGAGANGAGDPIGSAQMFPLVQTANGPTAVNSWSYQFAGGAALGSANPLRIQAGATGGVTVRGAHTYSYGGSAAASSFSDTLLFGVSGDQVTADQWMAAELSANPRLTAASLTRLSFNSAPAAARTELQALATAFFSQFPGQFNFTGSATSPTGVTTTLALAAQFLQQVEAAWPTLKSNFNPPSTSGNAPPQATVTVNNLVRTGAGSISIAAAGDIDLRNGVDPALVNINGASYQQGGAAIYTAGHVIVPAMVTAVDTATGQTVTLDPSAFATTGTDNVGTVNYGYGVLTPINGVEGQSGVLVSNPVYATGGGDISLSAGEDVLGRRDGATPVQLQAAEGVSAFANLGFVGAPDQPWRIGTVGDDTNILVNPQLFTSGVGTLGGGNIRVTAGGNVSDLTVVADTTVTTANATGPGVPAAQASLGLLTYGGGNVAITAGGDLLGGRIDVGSGTATLSVGGAVASAGTFQAIRTGDGDGLIDDSLSLRLTDATVDISAHGDVTLQGISALGVQVAGEPSTTSDADAFGFYSAKAGVSVVADGSLTVENQTAGGGVALENGLPTAVTDHILTAIWPGSLTAVSMEGNVSLQGGANQVLLMPTATGTLTVAAGADVAPATLAMLDNDPGQTPGLFSAFTLTGDGSLSGGLAFAFPAILPDSTFAQLEQLHDASTPHQDDPVPNRIYAGGDIDDVILSVPKQTRIGAGQDIVNMVFFGQNLNPNDVTRIVAGRDITATTQLDPAIAGFDSSTKTETVSAALSTLQGNTFMLGGPGSLIVQAGRNLGPFLNSATLDPLKSGDPTGEQSFAGGIITTGNLENPFLPAQGASIYTEFGVAKGQDFSALTNYYLNPNNFASLPDYLFNETLNANNVFIPDRSQPIYAPMLIAYMQSHEAAALVSAFGTTNVSYAQAYSAFAGLAPLQQQPFLLQVFFNELSLTSTPGPTLKQYARGYTAVNLLFPASLGYTANDLDGGSNGANALIHTGDLDLRLATIETEQGGDVDILGPGGEVLAGSTVATAQQAARRNSIAPLLYAGDPPTSLPQTSSDSLIEFGPLQDVQTVSTIESIPAGFEGVLTLRGGNISTFTDTDFVLNQSRLFTEQGGNIIMWSSNGDLNAGEGPKTSSNFPPVVVNIDEDALSQLDQASSVTGAGIAGFEPAPGVPPPNVYLIAPRGTVDAGAAGVRVAGNLFVASLHVANANNFQVGGTAIGLPPTNTTVNVSTQSTAASAAATQAAQTALSRTQGPPQDRSVITVEVLGFGDQGCMDPKACRPAGPGAL